MKFSLRELVYIGVFGALWGTVEIGLGSVWHVVNVPFSGVILSGIGITVALVGRLFVPRRGTVLAIGVVTACLKMFSVGGIVLSPMIGIIAESLCAELVLSALGTPRLISFVPAGAVATFWTLIHPFFTQGILAGEAMVSIYTRSLRKGAQVLGMDPNAVVVVIVALIVAHLFIGAVAGVIAWDIGQVVQGRTRLATHPSKAT